ncbi:DUF4446 family protein [Thermodesulfitimonas sp.]
MRYAVYIIGAAAFLGLLSCALAIGALLKLASLHRANRLLLRLSRDPAFITNIEELVAGLENLSRRVDVLSSEQEQLGRLLRKCTRTPVLKRFTAFPDVGGDLSFSLALLDGEGDGVILTSLYGREESRTYAKQVTAGTAGNRVSAEEEEVLQAARQHG